MPGKKNYVLLCSPAHSGSTLIACLAAAHPEISTVGEFAIPFSAAGPCSCGQPYDRCQFWQRWCRLAAESGIKYVPGQEDFAIGPSSTSWRWARWYHHPFRSQGLDRIRDFGMRHTAYHRQIQHKLDNIVRMAELLCDDEGTSTFLDTSKNSFQIRPLLAQDRMHVRCISLVRDGRAATMSLVKWYNVSYAEAVNRWLWEVRTMQRLTRYLPPDQLLQLRYEDMPRELATVFPRLFEFCGVDPKRELDYSPERRHIVGNAMRHTFDGTLRFDESWRSKITSDELQYFHQHAGRVNRALGYLD